MSNTILTKSLLTSFLAQGYDRLRETDVLQIASTYHPVRDIQFLERLDAGQITAKERAELLGHLAKCDDCRETLLTLIDCNALFDEAIPTSTKPQWQHDTVATRSRSMWFAVASCAVLVMLAVSLPFFHYGDSPQQLALKELNGLLTNEERSVSTQLTDHGYRLNGTMYTKSLAEMDERKAKIVSLYEKLIAAEPENRAYQLDYAKFLIYSLRDTEKAKEILSAAMAVADMSDTAALVSLHTLLGQAEFAAGLVPAAIEQFREALQLDSSNFSARLNLGIALYRNGDTAESLEIFRQLKNEPMTDTLQKEIDTLLEKETALPDTKKPSSSLNFLEGFLE